MTPERYDQLAECEAAKLTQAEKAEGWHFCPDMDGRLIGPGMDWELSCCECEEQKKKKVKQ